METGGSISQSTGSSSGVVTCYTGSSVIETTADNTTHNRTWKTGVIIDTPIWKYISKCLHTHPEMHQVHSISNKVFVTGSGNDDEWFWIMNWCVKLYWYQLTQTE